MKTINQTKTIGILFLFIFSASSNKFTKSFKANFQKICLLFVSILIFPTIGFNQENGGPYTTDDNTVLLMHFEDNVENFADVGINGIPHGSGVSYETSVDGHGKCIRLDNSTSDKQSWIEVPFYDELNFTDEFSIECWFKINSWGENHTYFPNLFRKGENWPADYNLEFGSSENRLQANLNCQNDEYDRGFNVGTYPGVIQQGTWYHISLIFKPQTEPKYWMYMDLLIRDENYNEIYATTGFGPTPPFNSDGKFFIGFGNNGNSYFDGWIDEFRISNKHRKYRDDIISAINTEDFKDSVPPMLRDNWTTYYPPITNYFPIDTITGERYKGNSCGMTIMIRLLHFWEHPRFPSGNIDYWFGPVNWQADLDNTEYLFDLMPDELGPNCTEEEYAASGIFAQQVSAATRIYYDNITTMPQLLTDYFHYKEGMKLYYRHQFTKEEWIKIFKNELSQGRPIMAAGLEEIFDEGGAAGHYYICDGYNSDNKFHSDMSMADGQWYDIDNFDYGKFQTIMIGAEPDWGNKELELIGPSSNKTYKAGSDIEIRWTSENISNLILEYSSDAGKNWKTISEEVNASSETYTWSVPHEIAKTYKVRISDKEDLNVYRKTNQFEVYNTKSFDIEYPQLNTKFKSGTRQPVYWNSTGISTLKLEYSINGQDWVLINDSVSASDGQTFVKLPDTVTDNIVLKATDINEPEQTFTSEKFKLITEQIWGGPYEVDDNTLLLMHFENNTSNEVKNQFLPIEFNPIGIYEENFGKNRGKAFRIYNPDQFTGDAFHVRNSENLDLGNNWTMEAWVKVTSIGGERNVASLIFNKWDVFAISAGWQYFGGFVNFENGTKVEFGCPQKYTLNKWYHIAMISDATQETVSFYVHDKNAQVIYQDGKPFPEGSNGMVLKKEFINDGEDKNLVTIGGLGGGSNFELDGYLDEVRITKSSKLMDYIEMAELPFYDDFNGDYENWTHFSNKGDENWHISGDDGIDGGKCARFYITSNPKQTNDDWLITQVFNTKGISNITIEFKYLFHGDGITPEFYYSNSLNDDISKTEWTKIDNSFWENAWSWNSARIEIENPGETFVFAIRYQSTSGKDNYILIDNFSIKAKVTDAEELTLSENNFKIYPNPITNNSIIYFTNPTSGKVNISVFDLQGRKICTVLDKNLTQGKHTVSLGNQIKENGVYFCTLTTKTERKTLKLVVNK